MMPLWLLCFTEIASQGLMCCILVLRAQKPLSAQRLVTGHVTAVGHFSILPESKQLQ